MKNMELLTDFYELTMMQGYFLNNPNRKVVFDYFIRKNPFESGFSVFAGLAPLIKEIENLAFDDESIKYLQSLNIFQDEFLNYLKNFKFSCDIYSVKEGEIIYPNEPILTISGSIIEAQLIESMLLNQLNFSTLIATKTARVAHSAKGRSVLEFGLRRAQGVDGAMSGSRAAFIGGCSSTSNTLAGKSFNIPVKGTMAHSWVMSFDSELESFEKYARIYPNNVTLLVDTYNTLESGIPNAIKVLTRLRENGNENYGIRLDSGNMFELSFTARKMLDNSGLPDAKIISSNELDETIIDEMVNSGCPIDTFGVGTKMITGYPDASLSGVYKLSAIIDKEKNVTPVIKLSDTIEKRTNPGKKNVMRFYNSDHIMEADLLYLEKKENDLINQIENGKEIKIVQQNGDDSNYWISNYQFADKLLKPVMIKGKVVNLETNLKNIKNYKDKQFNYIPRKVRRLINPHEYLLGLSENLCQLKGKMIRNLKK